MKIVTPELIRAHCRLDSCDDAAYIDTLACTAEDLVEKMVNRTWASLQAADGSYPQPLRSAVLLTIEHLYVHRGLTDVSAMYGNPVFQALINKYKKITD